MLQSFRCREDRYVLHLQLRYLQVINVDNIQYLFSFNNIWGQLFHIVLVIISFMAVSFLLFSHDTGIVLVLGKITAYFSGP
jgi:hypothetical protein